MIEFQCKNCGQKISVPQTSAGKKGNCPKCKKPLDVPEAESGYDLTLLDVPRKNESQDQPASAAGSAEMAAERGRQVEQGPAERVEVGARRKLPWLIDIFLYPASKPAVTVLGIVVVVRFLLRFVVTSLGGLAQQLPLFLIPFGLAWITGVLIRIVLYLYLYGYLCECIRDSAAGGIRAPETVGHGPGIGDMFWRGIRLIGGVLFFLGPAFFYFVQTKETDTIFWCLAIYAALSFPMSLMAVAMFDSFAALNPIMLIRSVFRTFPPYCAMILTFVAMGIVIVEKAPNPWSSSLTFFVTWLVGVYLAMVVAHLLGWFYHRYEEKLNWDV